MSEWGERKYAPVCSYPGCKRSHKAKGWCQAHYSQHLRRGWVGPIRSRGSGTETCTVPGCERPHKAKGLCDAHRDQMRTHGYTRPIRIAQQRGETKRHSIIIHPSDRLRRRIDEIDYNTNLSRSRIITEILEAVLLDDAESDSDALDAPLGDEDRPYWQR